MTDNRLQKEAVLRVGEVATVSGRRVMISVDRDKNLSELFFDGDLIRNVAVGSYIDIRKGFLSLIGKVDGENAQPETDQEAEDEIYKSSNRTLSVSLVGFLNRRGEFFGGTKELPLVGNEAYLLTREQVHQVHNLVRDNGPSLNVASSEYEGFDVALPVDGLMNSHIAIFGNTGSGKSHTLAHLYQSFTTVMNERNPDSFAQNCRILIFDFNGEYTREECITAQKTVYSLSTRNEQGDKIPLHGEGLLNIEMLSIISDATEKTQKPFLKRSHALWQRANGKDHTLAYTKGILRKQVERVLKLPEKERTMLLIDYFRQILPPRQEDGEPVDVIFDLEWHGGTAGRNPQFKFGDHYLNSSPQQITNTELYKRVDEFEFANDTITDFIVFAYVQLIDDVLSNRAMNEHIAPAINKLKSKQKDIRKTFNSQEDQSLFTSNVVVIDLHDVNLEMRKTIPLLVSRKVYQEHKQAGNGRTLNMVIDEAHNILSQESSREAETWKDYRLETFEEIIKEGRKFGVFVTIASQRPNDISPTITSQAHNYFIHRLINQKDLQSISNAVSYIDKLTEESIPTLPTGTCVFSGIAGQMPLKLSIKPLAEQLQPKSMTLKFADVVTEE